MWLVSQNKYNLVKIGDVYIEKKQASKKVDGKWTHTDVYNIYSGDFLMGIYVSEEKALQVMKDIINTIRRNNVTATYKGRTYPLETIYEMPEEL